MRGLGGYNAALRLAYEKIFGTIAEFGIAVQNNETSSAAPKPLLHISAFLRLTRFMEMPAYDISAWREPYDPDAVRETLRGIVDIVPIERGRLIAEMHGALGYVRSLADQDLFQLYHRLPEVDAPEIDWDSAAALNLDPAKLERALYHQSQWIVQLAAKLLANMVRGQALQVLATRLLANGERLTLWAGSALAVLVKNPAGAQVLCTRLRQPLVAGCEHAFQALQKLSPDPTADLFLAVQNGLLTGSAETAIAAAALVADWAKPGADELHDLLGRAYRHWQKHEEPYPTKGGTVPGSPREKILVALLSIQDASNELVFEYAADSRSDVSKIGRDTLLKRLEVSDDAREILVDGAATGTVSASLLSAALRAKIPFNAGQVRRISELLVAGEPKLRLAALDVLDEAYLPLDEVERLAKVRTADSNLEVREAAFWRIERRAAANKQPHFSPARNP
jgi:hypothetical protein